MISKFGDFTQNLKNDGQKMPLLFVGHGSPMNGIEDNEFSQRWTLMGKEIPKPKAVLCISAHWLTKGTHVTAMEHPRTIHDFGGFPKELFKVQYPASGEPLLAKETAEIIKSTNVGLNHDWGLDHGCWSVVKRMYPEADIPIVQMSIDYNKSPKYHYDLAAELSQLRDKGVLIIGSGNMVHNLRMIAWNENPSFAYDWATEMNEKFKDLILKNEHRSLIDYESLGKAAELSIPTPDHYYPLLYILGLKQDDEQVTFFNDKVTMGSLTMTSIKIN